MSSSTSRQRGSSPFFTATVDETKRSSALGAPNTRNSKAHSARFGPSSRNNASTRALKTPSLKRFGGRVACCGSPPKGSNERSGLKRHCTASNNSPGTSAVSSVFSLSCRHSRSTRASPSFARDARDGNGAAHLPRNSSSPTHSQSQISAETSNGAPSSRFETCEKGTCRPRKDRSPVPTEGARRLSFPTEGGARQVLDASSSKAPRVFPPRRPAASPSISNEKISLKTGCVVFIFFKVRRGVSRTAPSRRSITYLPSRPRSIRYETGAMTFCGVGLLKGVRPRAARPRR